MPAKPVKPSRRNPAVTTALIAAIGGIIAAAVTGIFVYFSSSPAAPSPSKSSSIGTNTQKCTGFRADVEIPSQVGPYPALTIDFNCAPAAGQQYLWVVEADGIGKR